MATGQFHTTASLGPKRHFTPEGFLVCEEVPIARIGEQLYFAHEVAGVEPGPDGTVIAVRDAVDVFADSALRSYHGKPITNDHPTMNVSPDTFRSLSAGTVLNPRVGEGLLAGWMVADFMICDRASIRDVVQGKKEVSCGYTADYEPLGPGRARQHNFIGNHVALVTKGRCGSTCAIGDSAPMTTFADRMRAALEGVLATATTADGAPAAPAAHAHAGEPPINIHIHNTADGKPPASPAAPAGTPALPGGGGPVTMDGIAALLKPAMDGLDALTKRMDKLEGKPVLDATPPAVTPPAKPADGKPVADSVPVLDAAAIPGELADLRSRCEIMIPGIKLPVLDAAGDPKMITDAICGQRRNALTTVQMLGGANAATLQTIIASMPTVDRMTCDQAKTAFVLTSDAIAARNNGGAGKASMAPGGGFAPKSMTAQHAEKLAEINKANRKHYGMPDA